MSLPMLELEVIPERAIAAGQWQFVLGKTSGYIFFLS